MVLRALVSILLSVAVVSAARAETVTLTAVRDNTLFQDAAGALSSGAGPDVYCGKTFGNLVRRALLAFDVSSLPTDAVIDSVRLELTLTHHNSDLTPRFVRIYRVLADWGEGSSFSSQGGGAPSQTGDATWIHTFYPASLWSKPGGDFAGLASDSVNVAGAGDYVWSGAGLASDVHGWTSQTAANYGWVLVGDETVAGSARGFSSREGSTPPRLVVHYSVATPVESTTWGKIKIRYR